MLIKKALPILIVTIIFQFHLKYIVSAEEITGDINGNGVIGLEEAQYALQIGAGLKPNLIYDTGNSPQYSAWGDYEYLSSTSILNLNFTFSNFAKNGPHPGTKANLKIISFSSTTISLEIENKITAWTRVQGTGDNLLGRWIYQDIENGTTSEMIYKSNGSFIYSSYGDAYTKVVNVPNKTITIDGQFQDWIGVTQLDLYWTNSDCGSEPGREIKSVYVTQDSNYVYLRMKLNGTPDPTFRFKFGEVPHIRVTPPPNPGIMIASLSCSGSIDNPLIVFNGDEFECRFDKCFLVSGWDKDVLMAWSDQDFVTECRQKSYLPILLFDVSNCND